MNIKMGVLIEPPIFTNKKYNLEERIKNDKKCS